MKRKDDDFQEWCIQREHRAEPYPCPYPGTPPRLRWRVRAGRGLYVLWLGSWLLWLGSLLASSPFMVLGWNLPPAPLAVLGLIGPFVCLLCSLLRRTPRLFWRCPWCGQPFPYYTPGRGDTLKNRACLHRLDDLHMFHHKPRLCPLVVPSECPQCRKKYYRPPEDGAPGQHRPFL